MLKYITSEIKNCYRFRFVTMAFVSSNLKHRYRRSVLGFVWTVLAPFLHYLVMGLVFSAVTKSNVPNFFAYYFTGAVFFSIVSTVITKSTIVFIGNEHFLKKIYLPKLLFVENAIIYEFANFLLTLISLFLLGNIFGQLEIGWPLLLLPFFFVVLFLFLIGISIIVAIGTVYFRDLLNIVPVVLQALFFATPIFYSIQDMPAKYQGFLSMNPLNSFLDVFRSLIFHSQIPNLNNVVVMLVYSLASLLIGILLLYKFENRIVFRL